MSRRAAAALGVVLAIAPGVAGAADTAEDLAEEIDRQLETIKGKLDGFANDTSTSDLDAVGDAVEKIEDQLDKLGDLRPAPTDEPAKTMLEDYGDNVEDFEDAIAKLKELKAAQLAQTSGQLTERCTTAGRELALKIKAYVDKNDPAGLTELPEYADELGEPLGRDLDAMDDTHRNMERWKGDAKRFGYTHGKWSNVKSELHSAADETFSRWDQRQNESHFKCDPLVKGASNPDVVAAVRKLGDSEAQRTQYQKQLATLVKELASGIKALAPASKGPADVATVVRTVEKISATIGQLDEVKGDDAEAKKIVEKWPPEVKELLAALDALKKLKGGPKSLDAVIDRCQTEEKGLQAKIRTIVGKKDPTGKGGDELKQLAKKTKETIDKGLAGVKKYDAEVKKLQASAGAFSFGEGDWGDVTSALKATAAAGYTAWTDRVKAVESTCENLAKGEDHPDVKRALVEIAKYAGGIKENYREVAKDYKEWAADVKKFREWLADDTEEVRKAICSKDESEVERAVNEVANRWKSKLASEWGSLMGRADRMIAACDALIPKGIKSAPKLKQQIVDAVKSLEKVKEGELLGSNNPRIRAAMEHGKKKHKEKQSGCAAKELHIESSYCGDPKKGGCYVDCVQQSGSTCTIIEIKPNNSEAKSAGNDQLNKYENGLQKKFAAKKTDMFKERNYGLFAKCVKGTTLNLDTKLDTYDFCPTAKELASELGDEPKAEAPPE